MSEEANSEKLCLVLLEGIGVSSEGERNAQLLANMENLEALKNDEHNLYYELEANGDKIGLAEGKPGNNGIGILVIGSGKRQYRNILRINGFIDDGSFKSNEVLAKVLSESKASNGRLHLIGCITDSGEEADIKQLYALLECAKAAGVENVFIHGILDGEDIPSGRGLELTKQLGEWMKLHECGKFGSICGRKGVIGVESDIAPIEKYMNVLMSHDTVVAEEAEEYIQKHYDIS